MTISIAASLKLDTEDSATKCKSGSSPTPLLVSPQASQLDNVQQQLNKISFDLAPLATLVADVKSNKLEVWTH
ncbi:unnamed protein product [Arctia plantaginis]|uniref:Uncharacterized protein n=1 Tax=Arctia plantaginis TaxID=874455 RepID=A0A8S0ZFQ4_ARCPL|nr:unnamed protein product [Arctia plantaginis]CAB3249896.1 unnamed protein product [Arctia plantaginis]